jgi:hypothetical protein
VRRVAGEVTRLNYEGQFKPFVYLNVAGTPQPSLRHQSEWLRPGQKLGDKKSAKKIGQEKSRHAAGFFLLSLGSN